MTTSTYAPPFLQSPYGQQGAFEQQQQFGPAQQFMPGFQQAPWQQLSGQTQQPIVAQLPYGGLSSGVEQIAPSIQLVVALLGSAQQCIWTAQQVVTQLPAQLATIVHQQQFGQQRQYQRPYSMAW